MTNILPESRRAEGIGYWGLSTIAAIAVAPTIGFWVYHFGWRAGCASRGGVLNLVMAVIAGACRRSPASRRPRAVPRAAADRVARARPSRSRCFSIRSATAGSPASPRCTPTPTASTPKGIYLTALAVVILVTRPFSGRLGDRFGYRRVFLPCLVLITLGLACLAVGGHAVLAGRRRRSFSASASAPPIRSYVGYVMRDVGRRAPRRRVRRHPRGVRYRHRHRLDEHGLDDRTATASRAPSAWPPRCRRSRCRIFCFVDQVA